MNKKVLEVAKRVGMEAAVRGAGTPSVWVFYENEIPSTVLEEVKKRQDMQDVKCDE